MKKKLKNHLNVDSLSSLNLCCTLESYIYFFFFFSKSKMIVVTKYTVRFLNIFVFVGLVLFHKFRRLRCFYAFLQRSSSMTHSNEAFKICLRLRLVKMPAALRGAEPSLGHNSESYSLFSFSTKSKLEFGLLIVTAAGSARLVLK